MRVRIGKFQLCRFIKTDHFMERQKQREISDQVVAVSLGQLQNIPKSNLLVVVSSRILREWAKRKIIHERYRKANEEVFIKIDRTVLVTCFSGEFGKYQGHRKTQNYWFVQKD